MPRCTRPALLILSLVLPALVLGMSGCPPRDNPRAPEASFTAQPREGILPLMVQFTNTSRPGASPIRTWVWDFGDGATSRDPNPRHEYTSPGVYTVRLTVETAEGRATRERAGYIKVNTRSDFAFIGPEGGAVSIGDATVTVPAGAFSRNTSMGVIYEDEPFRLSSSEPTTVLSAAFTIAHGSPSGSVFAVDEAGALAPGTIELAFVPGPVPLADRNGSKIHIVAKLVDGSAVPIFGTVNGGRITANVTGLPPRATYGVVYRRDLQTSLLNLDVAQAKAPTARAWNEEWRLYYSPNLLQQLTALRLGSVDAPAPYDRRNFTQAELDHTRATLEVEASAVAQQYALAGGRAPMAAAADGAIPLSFYNFASLYSPDFADFRGLALYNTDFGQLAIDPAQLINVSKHNAASGDPDLAQEAGFQNIFALSLYELVFDGYDYPSVVADNPDAGEVDVPFFAALRDGGAVYFGQRLGGLAVPRSFGPNETASLSDPLFAAFTPELPGYGIATQDFLFFLDNRFGIDLVDAFLEDRRTNPDDGTVERIGLLESVRERLAGNNGSFGALTAEMLQAIDASLPGYVGFSLGELYRDYVRERAIELLDAGILRPSDNARLPGFLEDALFRAGGLVQTAFFGDTTGLSLGGDDTPVLANVPPLASRAVVLDVDPATPDLAFSFNAAEWRSDRRGNSVAVKVYPEGGTGVALEPGTDSLVLNPSPCPFAESDTPALITLFFPFFDEDSNGGLSLAEAQAIVPEIDEFTFGLADDDADGELSPDEVLAMQGFADISPVSLFDQNENGYFEPEELTFLENEAEFALLDVNRNGFVDCGDLGGAAPAKQEPAGPGRVIVLISNMNLEAANSIYLGATRPAPAP